MGTPGVQTSPWVWSDADYLGRAITITVSFNDSTKALTGATIVRDQGCLYSFIAIGVGPDGTPNTSPNRYDIAFGQTNVGANRLKQNGLNTINDVLALQITAGQ